MAEKILKRLPKSKVEVFKIRNRAGFAAICFENLTEGKTKEIALLRMAKAVKRQGYLLS